MPDTKPIHPEYLAGVIQAFATVEVYLQNGGAITHQDIATELNHWQSLPVAEPSRRDISKIEVGEKTEEVKALNAQLFAAEKNIKTLKASLADLGLKVVHS